jgi:hypothetical protein
MRRMLIVLALVGASMVLGATVFREQVAWAAQAVDAKIIGPVDSNGNVMVHEQGTADVNVTNGTLSVAQPPVTGGGGLWITPVAPGPETIPAQTATSLTIALQGGASFVTLLYQGARVAEVIGAVASANGSAETVPVALSRPIKFDQIDCGGASSGPASRCVVTWVGAQP